LTLPTLSLTEFSVKKHTGIKMKKFVLLTTIFAVVTSINSYAAPVKKTISLDTVTVVATRSERDVHEVPGMVSVVDTSKPINSGKSKISDLLSGVSGVEFVGGPVRSGEAPTMRGFDSTSQIITLDGRRQNFESQHDGRFYIDPSLIKKVEVVKGSSSALYGSGGLGGVIAFETKDAKDFLTEGRTAGLQTSAGFASANQEISSTLSGYKVGEKSDQVASLVYRTSGNIELNNDTKQRSDDNIYAGYGKLTYDINNDSKIKFDINSLYNFAKENTNPQAGTVQTSGKNLVKKDILSNQAGVKYTFNPESKLIDLSTQLYYVDTAVNETIVESTTLNPVNSKIKRDLQTFGFNADNKSQLNDNLLSYGIELYHNIQDGSQSGGTTGLPAGQRPGVPDAKSTVFGTYLQDEISVPLANEMELLITPALRFDYYKNEASSAALPDDTENKISPKLASTLKINDNYNIFGNYSEGFRAPNLTELYSSGTHFLVGANANTFVANPNLRPESSRSFEFGTGAKFNDIMNKDDELRLKASRYITRASDYIEQVVTSGNIGVPGLCPFPFVAGTCNAGTTSFTNVPSANIWGYEFESNYLTSDWEFGVGASYVSAENARNGVALTTKQPLIFTSKLAYNFADQGITIGHKGKYADDNKKALRDLPNQINYRRPGFATHGVFLSYTPTKHKDLTLDFGIDNIFDKKYKQPFGEIYDMERNYRINVTYKW
jgi:hemoglobin/transferrin/lactoferrin receptor protein